MASGDQTQATAGATHPAPFVVGVVRSGTTLLRLMLDAHPELAIPAETHFVPRLIKRIEAGVGPREAARFVTEHVRWDDWGLDAGLLRRRFEALSPFSAGDAVRAFFQLYAESQGKPRWGDKSPPYLTRMAPIHAALPEARFIHVIRDGRDVAVSLMRRSWGPQTPAEIGAAWVQQIGKARRQARRKLPDDAYLEVRYEQLVAEPEPVVREVTAAIALPWDPVMLDYHRVAETRMAETDRDLKRGGGKTISARERSEQHAMVREPLRPDRAGSWREEMLPADRREFEAVAGGLLEELGYPLD